MPVVDCSYFSNAVTWTLDSYHAIVSWPYCRWLYWPLFTDCWGRCRWSPSLSCRPCVQGSSHALCTPPWLGRKWNSSTRGNQYKSGKALLYVPVLQCMISKSVIIYFLLHKWKIFKWIDIEFYVLLCFLFYYCIKYQFESPVKKILTILRLEKKMKLILDRDFLVWL